MHMLDRINAGVAHLPTGAYETAILLEDPEGTESAPQGASVDLSGIVWPKVLNAMQVGGRIRIQKVYNEESLRRDALLAGFLFDKDVTTSQVSLIKPKDTAIQAVPLNGRRKGRKLDLSIFQSDDLIDENSLLTQEDRLAAIIQPDECRPAPGKKRKACKGCTCGLKEVENQDQAKADQTRVVLDGSELDFTVRGKVSSCGNCTLGDAFRCEGCPYVGMPAFKPGERIALGGVFAGADL